MPTISVDQYEDLLRRSGIVEKDNLDRTLAKIGKPASTEQFARKLIEAKVITEWQNEKLMEGRHKGFFLGKYKLLAHLSRGGMSEVYLAEQVMMRRRVAIKVFPPDLIEQASYLERFYQESRTQASMDHPHIVRAHDFGNEGKIHYLVMEYVDGPDLENLVKNNGLLSYELAANYIQQAAEALSYAHSKSMIHRDIKPANLMLDRSGVIKLLDLGLVRITGTDKASLTLKHNENTLGTADYLAPEQAVDSHNVDERVDIYSLGCTLYYVLTGHPPFPEGTPVQRLMMHMNQEPPSIYEDRPDCPPEIVAICQKMMAKRADQRYQTAADVRDSLGNWLEANGFESSLVGPNSVDSQGSAHGGIRTATKAPPAAPTRTAPPPVPKLGATQSIPRVGAAPSAPKLGATQSIPRVAPSKSPAASTASDTKVPAAHDTVAKNDPQSKPVRQRPEPEAEREEEQEEAVQEAPRKKKSKRREVEEEATGGMLAQVGELAYSVAIGAIAGGVVFVFNAGTHSLGANAISTLLTWAAIGAIPGAVMGAVRLLISTMKR